MQKINSSYSEAKSFRFQNRFDKSRSIIDNHIHMENSTRYLKAVRESTDSPNSLYWFEDKMNRYIKIFGNVENYYFNKSILFHRFSIKDRAVELAQKRLNLIIQKNIKSITNKKPINWSPLAARALLDAKNSLDSHQIPFFLISGTLLGVIREDKLLEHDYDIDIGIDETVSYEKITSAFLSTGLFEPEENNFQNYFFSFTHLNGTKIDIFIHYKINEKYRHRTSYVAWDNTHFDLKPYTFLNQEFLIPKDPEKYLEENYGNWQTPVPNYNTLLDTPNLLQISADDYIFQLLILMAESFQKNNNFNFIRAAKLYHSLTGSSEYLNTL